MSTSIMYIFSLYTFSALYGPEDHAWTKKYSRLFICDFSCELLLSP